LDPKCEVRGADLIQLTDFMGIEGSCRKALASPLLARLHLELVRRVHGGRGEVSVDLLEDRRTGRKARRSV